MVRSIIVFAVIAALLLALRLPLLTQPGILLGWNSDSALFGLMAEWMVRHRDAVWLFWGEDYLGTLTSYWTLIAAPFTGGVTPLAVRLGNLLQIAASLTFCWCAFRRVWNATVATAAIAWLIAGPQFFFALTVAPLSAEQMLFVGSVILWYSTRAPIVTARQWAILGVLAGLGWWAHRGAMFAVVPAVFAHLYFGDAAARRRFPFFFAGAAVGVAPLIAGRMRIDQYLYTPVTPPFAFARVLDRIAELFRVDLWQFLGGITCGVVLLVLFAVGVRSLTWQREHVIIGGTIAVSFAFWILSPQAYSGATRYLMLALPPFLAICALAAARHRLAMLAAAFVFVFFTYARVLDVRAIAAGQREQYEKWPGGFDPRPALAVLDREQYEVCYADFWIAYKLELLSASRTRFVPYLSVDRTQRRSLALARMPGRKCFVSLDGQVKTLTSEEEARFRAETFAAARRRSAHAFH